MNILLTDVLQKTWSVESLTVSVDPCQVSMGIV